MSFKRILIAVNSSPFSMKAAKCGFDLAHALDAEVALLYVIDSTKESVSIETNTTRRDSETVLLKEAQDTIEQLIKMYNGSKKLFKFTPEGFPNEVILNTAKEWEADIIVMGTSHKTGLSQILRSSVTVRVVKHACVPVLVIPPEMK